MDEDDKKYSVEEPAGAEEYTLPDADGYYDTRPNPFKSKTFYLTYLATVAFFIAVSWLVSGGSEYWLLGALFLCIPCIVVGLIIWAFLRSRNRALALGILFGCITPFVAVFVVTGGCGLVVI